MALFLSPQPHGGDAGPMKHGPCCGSPWAGPRHREAGTEFDKAAGAEGPFRGRFWAISPPPHTPKINPSCGPKAAAITAGGTSGFRKQGAKQREQHGDRSQRGRAAAASGSTRTCPIFHPICGAPGAASSPLRVPSASPSSRGERRATPGFFGGKQGPGGGMGGRGAFRASVHHGAWPTGAWGPIPFTPLGSPPQKGEQELQAQRRLWGRDERSSAQHRSSPRPGEQI